jgi:DNA polymerase elongation subunit (family B)
MDAMPLILEPESRLYTSPVIVLDFQSLYPSQASAAVTQPELSIHAWSWMFLVDGTLRL